MSDTDINENKEIHTDIRTKEKLNAEIDRLSLYAALTYCRKAINISLVLICVIMYGMQKINAAPLFAIIIYNGLHLSLVSHYQQIKTPLS